MSFNIQLTPETMDEGSKLAKNYWHWEYNGRDGQALAAMDAVTLAYHYLKVNRNHPHCQSWPTFVMDEGCLCDANLLRFSAGSSLGKQKKGKRDDSIRPWMGITAGIIYINPYLNTVGEKARPGEAWDNTVYGAVARELGRLFWTGDMVMEWEMADHAQMNKWCRIMRGGKVAPKLDEMFLHAHRLFMLNPNLLIKLSRNSYWAFIECGLTPIVKRRV